MYRNLLPNPSLVAILLVIRTPSGPQFVFHYPAHPTLTPAVVSTSTAWRGEGSASSEASSTDSETDSSSITSDEPDHDDFAAESASIAPPATSRMTNSESDRRSRSYAGRSRRRREDNESDYSSSEEDERQRNKGKESSKPWESVFGFDTISLASVFSPGKEAMYRTKFELGIEELVFLGYPLCADSDGSWAEPRKRAFEGKEGNPTKNGQELDGNLDDLFEEFSKLQADEEKAGTSEAEKPTGAPPKKKSRLNMFHVIFVLNPPGLEYQTRVDDMFDHVVKEFSTALRFEQERTDYVYKQSEIIIPLRDKASQDGSTFHELWEKILKKSDLARAIQQVYLAISSSRIAHIVINNNLEISLQIPIITTTAFLPNLNEPALPGLHLSTAKSFEDEEDDDGLLLARHFTLLFLDSIDSILHEISQDPSPFAETLAHFVSHCKSTRSFVQISAISGIPLAQIQSLAHHLIYWRRARAIPPIHPRDTYIVSPNADLRKLRRHSEEYAELFPGLPSLPRILSMLSSKPKPYSQIIPPDADQDEHDGYLAVLEWLLRHAYVTQLRTFAFLRVSPEIKKRAAKKQLKSSIATEIGVIPSITTERPASQRSEDSLDTGRHSPLGTSILQKTNSASALMIPGASSNSGSTPAQASSFTASSELLHMQSNLSTFETADINTPSFILNPSNPSEEESLWLEEILLHYLKDAEDLQWVFSRVAKYLDGRNALEKVAVREGIHRRDVRKLLAALDGTLVFVRHW